MFLDKLWLGGKKMHFIQKQKLFQKLWAIVKQMKKFNFQNKLFLGDLWSPNMGQKGQNNLIHEPLTPLKKNWEKISFFHLFYNGSKFLEQILFLVKMHFFTPKR